MRSLRLAIYGRTGCDAERRAWRRELLRLAVQAKRVPRAFYTGQSHCRLDQRTAGRAFVIVAAPDGGAGQRFGPRQGRQRPRICLAGAWLVRLVFADVFTAPHPNKASTLPRFCGAS